MNQDEIDERREQLNQLRRQSGNASRNEVEGLALRQGWRFRPKRGGHPVYAKPGRLPLVIPGHRVLNKYTLGAILDQLEADLDREEEDLRGR